MAQMLLVNPRKRRKRRASSKARKVRVRRRRRAAPVAVRRRKRNPSARRHRRVRARRHYRRNPIGLNLRGVQGQVMDAAVGAGGALALDIALGYLPIPENLRTGAAAPLIKGIVAIALGMVASKVIKSSTATKMTQGALTVMLHGIFRETAGRYMPTVQMGDWNDGFGIESLGYYGSGENPGVSGYLTDISAPSGLSEYAQASGDFGSY